MVIKVHDVINKTIAMSTEDAKKLYEELHLKLSTEKEKIYLSFEGIDILISHFLTESIGKLYGKFEDWDKLDKAIEVTNMDSDDLDLLNNTIIVNSKNHYKDTKRSEKIETEILSK